MQLLLDTHVFVWWLQDSAKLSKAARAALADPAASVFVSAVSIWEIAIKMSLRKLSLRGVSHRELPGLIEACGFVPLPLRADAAARVLALPHHHRDPFDRALIAQALVEGLTLVTGDAALRPYPIRVLDV